MGPYVVTALRARELHKRDVQYIVRDGDVKIVNSSTGRVLPISRWMDDLHQVCPWPSAPRAEDTADRLQLLRFHVSCSRLHVDIL